MCCRISCAHEDHHAGESDVAWRRRRMAGRTAAPALADLSMRPATRRVEIGIPKVEDFNRGDNEGSDYFEINQRRGRRWSAATAFLKPVLGAAQPEGRRLRPRRAHTFRAWARRRPRLCRGTASLLRLERAAKCCWRRARSARRGSWRFRSRPAGVVQAAGARLCRVARRRRKSAGSPSIAYGLPHPGRAHPQCELPVRCQARVDGPRLRFRRRGPLTMAPSQLGMFAKSSPDYDTANVEFHVQPLSLDRFGEPLHDFPAITISVCNLRPTSVGSTHAMSADSHASPAIRPNYLSTPEDRRVAVELDPSRAAPRRASALARYRPRELKPGAELQSEDDLTRPRATSARRFSIPSARRRWAVAEDPLAVVDSRLRVIGVPGLRVVDASVMPRIVSGNTAAPTMMIAERGADMILADAKAGS